VKLFLSLLIQRPDGFISQPGPPDCSPETSGKNKNIGTKNAREARDLLYPCEKDHAGYTPQIKIERLNYAVRKKLFFQINPTFTETDL
jgi:hypothetical protein